jgi:protein-S-isoprenylcysteine O-methyltransferase Ste14
MNIKFINIFWLAFSVLLWGCIHSFLASQQFKAFARRVMGSRSDRYYRIAYNLFAIISFILVLIVAVLTPDRTLYVIPSPWVALMVIIEFLAGAALLAGFMQTDPLDFLGFRQVREPRQRKPSQLMKDGLYHYVRHPLYSAGLVFIWMLPFMTVRVLIINLALTIYVIAGAYVEERKLRLKYGLEYKDYAAVTPMFIPFIKNKQRRRQSR